MQIHLVLCQVIRNSISNVLHSNPVDSVPFIGSRAPLAVEDVTEVPLAARASHFSACPCGFRGHMRALHVRVETLVPCWPPRVLHLRTRRVQRQVAPCTDKIALLRKEVYVRMGVRRFRSSVSKNVELFWRQASTPIRAAEVNDCGLSVCTIRIRHANGQ